LERESLHTLVYIFYTWSYVSTHTHKKIKNLKFFYHLIYNLFLPITVHLNFQQTNLLLLLPCRNFLFDDQDVHQPHLPGLQDYVTGFQANHSTITQDRLDRTRYPMHYFVSNSRISSTQSWSNHVL